MKGLNLECNSSVISLTYPLKIHLSDNFSNLRKKRTHNGV